MVPFYATQLLCDLDNIFCHKLVGIWFVNQWMLSGKNKVQLVELGPGRGTLASDVLRVSH